MRAQQRVREEPGARQAPAAALQPARPAGRPRILILTVGLTVGGAEQLILMTAPRLQRDGFDVTVCCLKGWGILGDELEARGVRTIALGARHLWDLHALGRLVSILKRDRIQILRSHLFYGNVVARLVGRLASVPVVVGAYHDTHRWMRWYHRIVERLTAPLCDAVTSCSESVRLTGIEEFGLSPVLVRTVHNAIELPTGSADPAVRERVRRDLGAGPDDLLIGALGRLDEPKKGIGVFLSAARLLARELPRARFAIVGEGPARPMLEREAEREGVSHRTVFAGQRRDVFDVMRAFDVYVLSSNWEGFGITLLEAMAVGTPVVGTRVGGVPEVIEDGIEGLLVPAGDPSELARACGRILGDPVEAARMGRAGAARVRERFEIERLVGQLEDLYRELLERRQAGSAETAAAPRRGGA